MARQAIMAGARIGFMSDWKTKPEREIVQTNSPGGRGPPQFSMVSELPSVDSGNIH
jgi:hypothetical protein